MTGKCWEVSGWSGRIEPIEIIRETEKQIVTIVDWFGKKQERRGNKARRYIFATWEEAKAYKIKKAEADLVRAQENIAEARLAVEAAHRLVP